MWLLLWVGCQPQCESGDLCPIMGMGNLGFNGDGLPGAETLLASPTSVLEDEAGRPMVVDYSNMRIRVLADDGTVETVAGSGIHAYSEPGMPALESPLENPVDATWGPDGLLYILPQHEGRVIRVDPSGEIVAVVGTGEIGDTGDGGDATAATLGYGGGLAFAEDGTLFVADNSYSRVRRVDPVSNTIETVLGVGEGGGGEIDADAHGPEVAIRSPERLVVDDEGGRLLVTDTLNHRVLAVGLDDWTVEVVAGTGESGYDGDGGPATAARLNMPVGLEVVGGCVLISAMENHVVRVVDAEGTIETVAGTGEVVSSEDPGLPLEHALFRPAGLYVMASGDILLAERSGHRVVRWVGGADAL